MNIIRKIWSKSKRKAIYLSDSACHILGLDKDLDTAK
ncbi:hypothetical protein FHW88_001398 [Mucilaginibacter sp. SG538B]|nr:hypothetical protein [Mucilaginibacter sp. SG538B]